MRHHRVSSTGGGINWKAPQSLSVTQNLNDYTTRKLSGNAVAGQILAKKTAPVSGRANTVYGEARLVTDGGSAVFGLLYPITGDELVLAPGRQYSIDGTLEVRTSPVVGDPPNYKAILRCYRDEAAANLIEEISFGNWSDAGSTSRLKNYANGNFTLPTGTRFIEIGHAFTVTNDNTSGPEIYMYDVTIQLET
jgi:hypothetical protein